MIVEVSTLFVHVLLDIGSDTPLPIHPIQRQKRRFKA